MLYTVYGLHEAGKPDDIQYTGITSYAPQQRLAQHLNAARHKSLPVNEWILRSILAGISIACRVLAQTEDAEFAHQLEKEMITYFAEQGAPTHNVIGCRRTLLGDRQRRENFTREFKASEALRVEQLYDQTARAIEEFRAKLESGELSLAAMNAACGVPPADPK